MIMTAEPPKDTRDIAAARAVIRWEVERIVPRAGWYDREALVQDLWVRWWQSGGPLARRIIRLQCWSYVRKVATRASRHWELQGEGLRRTREREVPPELDVVDELRVLMERAKLTEREKHVLWRRFWQGESLRVIARAEGESHENVRNIVKGALKKLRSCS